MRNNYKRCYSEAIKYDNFGDRLEYLRLLDGNVNSPRAMSNEFYKSRPWLTVRDEIIKRDLGMDLGVNGNSISDRIIVHHINPITDTDIIEGSYKLFDPENLITVSIQTHNAIHYGSKKEDFVERKPGDTKLW